MKIKRDLAHTLHFAGDLYRLATLQFQHPGALFKYLTLAKLGKDVGASTFIETGTYMGDTARRAAAIFEHVVTIELDPALARNARESLASCRNVEVIEADALVALPRVMQRAEVTSALIFLDGHASGGVTACGDVPEPGCLELDELRAYQEKIEAVVVDDFRCFGTEPGFPSKRALIESVDAFCGDRFTYTVAFDQVVIRKRAAQHLGGRA